MKERLLTISIPTYNRAMLLDDQLHWLAGAVKGNEDLCELIVSDNASTDATPEVMAKWEAKLGGTSLQLQFRRNQENLGAIRNIASGLVHARGAHVWTISDDDAVAPGAIRFVLSQLQANPDLSLMVLNFSSRHWQSGNLTAVRCFAVDRDREEACGQDLFAQTLSHPNPSKWGGLALTTALIYQTEVAQAALRTWPEGLDNLTLQLFITAYCARKGKMLLTKDTHLEMASGRHFFCQDRAMYFRFKVAEIPEALVKLAEIGYPRSLCREKILHQKKEITPRLLLQNFWRGPLHTFRVLHRYRAALALLDAHKELAPEAAENPF
jgi:hypothetical protein